MINSIKKSLFGIKKYGAYTIYGIYPVSAFFSEASLI